jgi:lactate dehydrogenase-like 2-hydroxyacid dehydrogenase
VRVFVTRRLPGDGLDRLASAASVDVWPEDGPPPYDELLARSRGSDGVLCLLTDRIDERVLDGLRVASQMAVGVDNIDLAAATRLGVPIGHTPGVLTDTTADLTWALILATSRRLMESERFLREGRWITWSPGLLLGADVHGATLGIVGKGAIGRAVARRAEGFGMRVLFATRERESLERVLEESDIVSLHCSLNESTRGLIGPDELKRM